MGILNNFSKRKAQEGLSEEERYAKAVDELVDMFGYSNIAHTDYLDQDVLLIARQYEVDDQFLVDAYYDRSYDYIDQNNLYARVQEAVQHGFSYEEAANAIGKKYRVNPTVLSDLANPETVKKLNDAIYRALEEPPEE